MLLVVSIKFSAGVNDDSAVVQHNGAADHDCSPSSGSRANNQSLQSLSMPEGAVEHHQPVRLIVCDIHHFL